MSNNFHASIIIAKQFNSGTLLKGPVLKLQFTQKTNNKANSDQNF